MNYQLKGIGYTVSGDEWLSDVGIAVIEAAYTGLELENARLRAAIEQIRRYADNEEVEMVCKETLAACDDLQGKQDYVAENKP